MALQTISLFQVEAALWVIRAVDIGSTDRSVLDQALHHAATEGRFPRLDLDLAYQLLVDHRLLVVDDARIAHHQSVVPLLDLMDDLALPLLEELFKARADLADANWREEIGALGEEAVAAWCSGELSALGYHDLVTQVKRVSLISDRFGYDIIAPSLEVDVRMLEVKTSTSEPTKAFRLFLTRNEYEVGRRYPRQWALVACIASGGSASILGWCRASELERYLPDDGNGRWIEAVVILPMTALLPGVPSAIP